MNQTDLTLNSTSDGVSFEVSTDGGSTFDDMGVMENGYSWTYAAAISDREVGNAENPDKVAKNQQVTIAPSELGTWKGANIAAISGGLMTSTAVAGTLVSGATDTLASGAFALNTAYPLDGQNSTGLAQTINSVTGSVDAALVLGTDYEVVSASGGWGITLLTGVTLAQSIVIDYDYTPASSVTVSSGSTSTTLAPYIARFTHYTNSAKTTWDFRHTIYRVNPDAGSITMNKNGAKSDQDFDFWTLALTGDIDTDRDDGDQLDSVSYAS